jgi:hypothetical protein
MKEDADARRDGITAETAQRHVFASLQTAGGRMSRATIRSPRQMAIRLQESVTCVFH